MTKADKIILGIKTWSSQLLNIHISSSKKLIGINMSLNFMWINYWLSIVGMSNFYVFFMGEKIFNQFYLIDDRHDYLYRIFPVYKKELEDDEIIISKFKDEYWTGLETTDYIINITDSMKFKIGE